MVPTNQGPLKSRVSQIILARVGLGENDSRGQLSEFQRPPSLWRPRGAACYPKSHSY